MKLSVRTKLVGNLVIAAALPLAVAGVTLLRAGYRRAVNEHGAMTQREAQHLAWNLRLISEQQIDELRDLLVMTDLADGVAQLTQTVEQLDAAPGIDLSAEAIESQWPGWSPESPQIRSFLDNPVAVRLRSFQEMYPLFSEILVTDESGRLIAATEKTSDYYQADEDWWQSASVLQPGEAWVEGLGFDVSAGVLSLDVCLPVWGDPGESRPRGVLKGVLNAMPLFASIPSLSSEAVREVVRDDGEVLLRLMDQDFLSGQGGLPAGAMDELLASERGWKTVRLDDGESLMVGLAPLSLFGVHSNRGGVGMSKDLYVTVSQDARAIMAPIRAQVIQIVMIGSLLVVGFISVGIYFMGRHFVQPIRTIRAAAYAIAATVKTGTKPAKRGDPVSDLRSAEALVARAEAIRTGDEIEALGRDFADMAKQLLNYQKLLEADVVAKTQEIQRDLEMAREFQQALLPHDLEAADMHSGELLDLNFHHIYMPVAALSGDFFDVIKLPGNRIGVVIADVMGHGTRSALVTAILRTMIQEASGAADDPGKFLSMLGREFYRMIEATGQLVFVTVAYLIVDPNEAKISCASAGHPCPFIGNRKTGAIEPFYRNQENDPALGLFPESEYTVYHRQFSEDEIVFLYTDGIIEAVNKNDEEFGVERLTRKIHDGLGLGLPILLQSVIKSLLDFASSKHLLDDVCLIGIEARSKRPRTVLEEAELEAVSHAGDRRVFTSSDL